MRVRVIKPFKDKHTGVKYMGGREIETTEARAREINAAKGGPYVEYDEPVKRKGRAPKEEEISPAVEAGEGDA